MEASSPTWLELAAPPSASRWNRLPALGLAIVTHGLVFVALSLVLAAHRPGPGAHSVAVTLVSSGPAGRSGDHSAAQSETLDSLQKRLAQTEPLSAQAPSPSPASVPAPPTSLSELLGEDRQSQPRSASDDAKGASGSASSGAADGPDPYAYASLSAAGAKQAASRSLRDQALRCWRGGASRGAVRLSVILDDAGAVRGRPTVLRSAAGDGPSPSPEAVARAVAAVRDCSPYLAASGHGGRAYELEFH